MTRLSFCTLFSNKSPCLIVDCSVEHQRLKIKTDQSECRLCALYLIEEVLAVWSVGLHNSAHLVNTTVQPSRRYEL